MLGIIGGSGLANLNGAYLSTVEYLDSAWGQPSSPPMSGYLESEPEQANHDASSARENQFYFIARHGVDHSIPPHRINYRANIDVLYHLGVTQIIAINAVGACDDNLAPGSLLLPDQLIDYTWGRDHTFFDALDSFADHVDFTWPFDRSLAHEIASAANTAGIPLKIGGTYGCTQGPRFETAAEIRRLRRDGCDVVGMTAMPEAGLAREKGVAYSSICIIVNPAAGVGPDSIPFDAIDEALSSGVDKTLAILLRVLDARRVPPKT